MNTTEPVLSAYTSGGAKIDTRISELVASGSVEMSPRDAAQITEAARVLPANTRVYVNALPGRLHYATLRAMEALRDEGLDPVPHIAARRLESRAALEEFVQGAVHAGAHRVLLIGGDQPAPAGPYASSMQVLREGTLAKYQIREVGFAGYPEGHPRIEQPVLDEALSEKIALASEQGIDVSIVTQFSFVPVRIAEYCALMARTYPQLPLYVGMAGPTSTASLLRYAQHCGVSASLRALSGMGVAAAKLVTHSDPMEQLASLAHHCEGGGTSNAVGAHFFSFGGFANTARFINRIIAEASGSVL
ncbi:MAG: methylenetetrahydrofolate reductase [Betaproteobacteria bacterium]|jgi:methylenetetrahydrofolate reductase (NADPH)|nr:MAG: methylenetetrahydrofolate reductase [Betaproteobacteria bacterium]